MKYSMILGAALALGLAPAAAWAQEPIAPGPGGVPPQTERAGEGSVVDREATGDDEVVAPGLVRASQLMDRAVYNPKQEQVGSISDIVLESKSGKIRYIALSTGGFLGVGDKLFAIPWMAFETRTQDGEQVCVLNVDEQTLANAQGFDQENWPNMADRRWQQQNDRQFMTEAQRRAAQQQRTVRQPGAVERE